MDTILNGKKILLGVTGSIAAYKSPLLVRDLIKAGADVSCVMTASARNFVTPMILANLSRNEVLCEMFDESVQTGGAWHILQAHSCDLMIIAPCSASTMGKIAHGICDNALVTLATALPAETPLLIAPAMDTTMYLHASTQRNLNTLRNDGAIIIPPAEGELSSGLTGPGRLPETDVLMRYIRDAIANSVPKSQSSYVHGYKTTDDSGKMKDYLNRPIYTIEDAVEKDKWKTELDLEELKNELEGRQASNYAFFRGKKVLITAGPTYEKIDDVRFIANYSSGKMGFALAKEARKMGAEVCLVCGPVNLTPPAGVKIIDVVSARDMYDEVMKEFPTSGVAIMAAAVADFTPSDPKAGKIKKTEVGNQFTIDLNTTQDILASLGKLKKSDQKLVGFALESVNEVENGRKKLSEKNCDIVVVNSANKPQSGFQGDDNTITLLFRTKSDKSYKPMSKELCAQVILNNISEL